MNQLNAKFHDIPFAQQMITADHLSLKGAAAPDTSRFELFVKVMVYLGGELFNRAPFFKYKWFGAIRLFAWRLGVDANEIQPFKN